MKNYCKFWDAAKILSAAMRAEGVDHVLIGTSGLAALGCGVEHADLDFLVAAVPALKGLERISNFNNDPKYQDGTKFYLGDVLVNLIVRSTDHACIAPPILRRDEVPIAPIRQILELKKRANRLSDRAFFTVHPELAVLVQDAP